MSTGTDTMDDEPMNAELPPPSPPPPPRMSWWHVPISRDPSDRKIGGVVSGVSRAFGFDRRTTRFAVAIAAIAIPGVIALYIAALILLPHSPAQAKPLSTIVTERRRRPLLIVLAAVALFTGFGSWSFFGGVGWGFALLAVGVVLWLAPNVGTGLRPVGDTGTWGAPTDAAATVGAPAAGGPAADAAPSATTSADVGRPRRKRYPVQAVGLAGAAVTALTMGLGNSADWWTVTVYAIAVTVLSILVGATVLGAIVNRSWYGLPMLWLLMVLSAGLLVTHPNLDGGFGDRMVSPSTVAETQPIIRLGAGRLTIDLTAVTGEQPIVIDAEVGYGQIHVIVPAGAELRLVSQIGIGHLVVDGEEITSGVRHEDTRTVPGIPATAETAHRSITLELSLGAGEISVEHSS